MKQCQQTSVTGVRAKKQKNELTPDENEFFPALAFTFALTTLAYFTLALAFTAAFAIAVVFVSKEVIVVIKHGLGWVD